MREELKQATAILQKGGILLFPTDTVWSLGCDATNEKAVEKLFQIKQREVDSPMIILLDNEVKIPFYVEVPDIAWDLMEVADSPLTIIYSEPRNIAENLVNKDRAIGIRITNETFSKALCEMFRRPIVATPASKNDNSTPEIYKEINPDVIQQVDYVVQFRQEDTRKGKLSSIIKVEKNNVVKIIRA